MNDELPGESGKEASAGEAADSGEFVTPNVIGPRLRRKEEAEHEQFTPPSLEARPVRAAEFKPARSKEEDQATSDEGDTRVNEVAPAISRGRKRDRKKSQTPNARFSTVAILSAILRAGFKRRFGVLPVLLLLGVAVAVAAFLGRRQGEMAVRKEFDSRPVVVIRPISSAAAEKLKAAMVKLREGNPLEARRDLEAMEETPDAFPSLGYLVAVAALQGGEMEEADKRAEESIARNERVSDALALRAVVSTQEGLDRSRVKLGDPIARSEQFLRQAIAVDPSNPYPHFELANLLRFQRKPAEALEELLLAKALLNPMDSHLVMDLTIALLKLEDAPLERLPTLSGPTQDPRLLIPAAYASMRRGDFVQAAALLQTSEAVMSPEVFDYVVNDLALRRFGQEAPLAPFYRR